MRDPRIYSQLYTVKIPQLALHSNDNSEVYLDIVNGEEVMPDLNRMVIVMRPIIEIARVAYSGFSVTVVGQDMVEGIHRVLEDHLVRESRGDVPNKPIDEDDLEVLEYLATSIFNINIGIMAQSFKERHGKTHADEFGLLGTKKKKETFDMDVYLPKQRI